MSKWDDGIAKADRAGRADWEDKIAKADSGYSPQDPAIEDILDEFFIEAQGIHDEYDKQRALEIKKEIFEEATAKISQLINEAKQEQKQLFLKMIGPNAVEEDDSGGKYKLNKYVTAENRLRRELRAKLERSE